MVTTPAMRAAEEQRAREAAEHRAQATIVRTQQARARVPEFWGGSAPTKAPTLPPATATPTPRSVASKKKWDDPEQRKRLLEAQAKGVVVRRQSTRQRKAAELHAVGARVTQEKVDPRLTTEIVLMAMGAMKVDPTYQRGQNDNEVLDIALNFDWARFGKPTINLRPGDGNWYVIDGQQRRAALDLLGLQDKSVECIAYRGLTLPEEAYIFDALNSRHRAVSSLARFKARLGYGDAAAVAIRGVVQDCGLVLQLHQATKVPLHIVAVSSLDRVYSEHGADHLALTLSLLRDWAPDDPDVFMAYLISGTATFLHRYRDERINLKRFLAHLRKIAPDAVIRAKSKAHQGIGERAEVQVAKVLRDLYNRIRGLDALPEWR